MSDAAPRPAAVALEGIAKKFGAFVALRDVTLAIEPGELVCFLGPSGCGKTTLLRIIAGLERQNAGLVRMAGRDVSGLPPAQRNYGIVFQSYALFPNLSVARNVAYGLERRRAARSEIDGRVDELLALVGLAQHRHKYPAQLSGGEQQRVALARAFAARPPILLADEPTGNLDGATGRKVLELLTELRSREGTTLVLVTHDPAVAALAGRQIHLLDGRVERDETARPAAPPVPAAEVPA